MSIDIRLATNDDSAAILEFIRIYWRADHIFIRDPDFFRYEMCTGETPNFIVAWSDNAIVGILGFIYTGDTISSSDLFLVLLRVHDPRGKSNAGLKLISYARSLTSKGVHTVGLGTQVVPYYRFLGFKAGTLDHYFWISAREAVRDYFSMSDNAAAVAAKAPEAQVRLWQPEHSAPLQDFFNSARISTHHKSINFFIRRFVNHPIYKYSFFVDDEKSGCLVVRAVSIDNFLVWRIVDFIGDYTKFDGFLGGIIQSAIRREVDLIDLYVHGVETSTVMRGGFQKVENNLIAPNHLSPLRMRNTVINFASSSSDGLVFFRGDCDQDRPS